LVALKQGAKGCLGGGGIEKLATNAGIAKLL
jgi:hypothetical protein